MSRIIPIVLLLWAVSIAPRASWAQASSNKAAAEALYQQGKKLFAEQKYESACEKFDASQKLEPAIGTLLFLGDCYEKVDRKASAWAAFKEAASMAEASEDADRRKVAEVRAAALFPQLAMLVVRVPPNVRAAQSFKLRRDGQEMPTASFGVPLPVDAGTIVIEASADGFESWSKTVTIPDGQREISVDVPSLQPRGAQPLPTPAPIRSDPARPEETTEDGSSTALLVAGIAVGVVGLAGIAVGSVFGVMARDSRDASLLRCRTETFCSPEGVALRQDAQDEATVSTITFIVGGVLAAGGITLVILSQTLGGSPSSTALSHMELLPAAGPSEIGFNLRGAW